LEEQTALWLFQSSGKPEAILQQLRIENGGSASLRSRAKLTTNVIASAAKRRSNPEKTSAFLPMLWIASLRYQ
jgi:hypothetical protein